MERLLSSLEFGRFTLILFQEVSEIQISAMESTWVGFDAEEKEKEESTIEKKKRMLC
jgi:hypothetical protein